MRLPRLAILSFSLLVGCGDSVTGPSYDDIAGSYSGPLVGLSQGVALNSVLSLTLTQQGGALSGSYAITGTLSDGFSTVPIQGTGTLSGSIAAGGNPSVNVTVRSASCPNQTATFSGAYDSVNMRLTITGPVYIFSDTCGVVLTYPSTIILTT